MLLAVGRGAARRAAVVCGAGRRLSSATASFIYDVTSADFGAKVLQAPVPVILDCHADWCGPCKQLGPVLKEHVAALQGTVALAMLDVDAEQELSGQLNIKSLPTVFGVWKGGVQDHFVGAKSDAEVAAFVRTMAALGGGGGAAEGDGGGVGGDGAAAAAPVSPREAAFRALVEDGDVATAAHGFKAEYERLKAGEAGDDLAKKKKTFTPLEFDGGRDEAKEMAWCLLGLARCALANDPPEPDAVAHLLGTLRDPKRANVLNADADLKAAVSHVALAMGGASDAPGSPLAAARDRFVQGDAAGALDLALDVVKQSKDDADAKEEARALVLDFIDALGNVPAAARARRKLAMYLN